MKKLFDLHVEMGECDKGHYFKLVFADGTEFLNTTSYLGDAISGSAYQLKTTGVLDKLKDGTIKSVMITPESIKAILPTLVDGQKLKPSELTQVDHPDCQPLCTSFDFFGKGKCSNMCGQRVGV